MSDFIIDAYVLACPDPSKIPAESFEERFQEYLAKLADFSTLRHSLPSIKFWRDEELATVLHETDCYPFRHSLAKAFSSFAGDADFQLEDANILAMSLLERSHRLEEFADIADVVTSSWSIANDPVEARSDPYVESLCRATYLGLHVFGDGTAFPPTTFLASVGRSGGASTVDVGFEVELVEYSDGRLSVESPRVSTQMQNYCGVEDFFDTVDLTSWWHTADDHARTDCFFVAMCREKGERSEAVRSACASLNFGADFVATARTLGFMHEPSKINRLLRVLADLVLGRNLVDSHWLRTGRGANEPQRTRGEWKAWRHDIDYEFHLHYWRKGTCLELANIVVHNDFSIS